MSEIIKQLIRSNDTKPSIQPAVTQEPPPIPGHFDVRSLRIEPIIFQPFSKETFQDLAEHVRQVRRLFDFPGSPYHDANAPASQRFNRWQYHELPVAKELHNSVELNLNTFNLFGKMVRPSYCFVSMYGPDGVCPLHVDRPPCQFTIDLLLDGGEDWPIYIEDKPYILKSGQAICYSGTGQKHHRRPMRESSNSRFANLVFFHYVLHNWPGSII